MQPTRKGLEVTSLFDGSPVTYERARPVYPEPLWDELFAKLPPRPSLVEIGPGTGKATVALLARGARVVACEPGANLSEFLRANFPTTDLDVRNETFEASSLEEGRYDGVVAATSFHWVDRSVRLPKSHSILKADGTLAIIDTNQVASDVDRGYFEVSQPIYRQYFPDEPSPPASPGRDIVPTIFEELRQSDLFEGVQLHRYNWDQRYKTAQYIDLVRSYSGTAKMDAANREAFLAALASLIESEFDGYVVRPLVITLVCATRRR